MLQDGMIQTLALDESMKIVILTSIVAICFLAWVLFSFLGKATRTAEREKTKRDLAAYVAEGSISPEDAIKLANAGGDDFEELIKQQLAAGIISPKKAESLRAFNRGGCATS